MRPFLLWSLVGLGLWAALLLAAVAVAAPRGASDSSHSPAAVQALRGAPHEIAGLGRLVSGVRAGSGAPLPRAGVGPEQPILAAGTISGLAGYAVPSLGSRYLAMRLPHGTLVTIRGPGGSWTTRVSDYGPSSRIRPPRVADIALGEWRRICGLPASAGLCRVRVTILSGATAPRPTAPTPTAPNTDAMEEPR